LRTPGEDAVALLKHLAEPGPSDVTNGARIRRLSLEALIAIAAVDAPVLAAATRDPDGQVRRIAMRAAAVAASPTVSAEQAHAALAAGLTDGAPAVRLEALRTLRARDAASTCASALSAVSDKDVTVALFALDQLGQCAALTDAVAALEQAV